MSHSSIWFQCFDKIPVIFSNIPTYASTITACHIVSDYVLIIFSSLPIAYQNIFKWSLCVIFFHLIQYFDHILIISITTVCCTQLTCTKHPISSSLYSNGLNWLYGYFLWENPTTFLDTFYVKTQQLFWILSMRKPNRFSGHFLWENPATFLPENINYMRNYTHIRISGVMSKICPYSWVIYLIYVSIRLMRRIMSHYGATWWWCRYFSTDSAFPKHFELQ